MRIFLAKGGLLSAVVPAALTLSACPAVVWASGGGEGGGLNPGDIGQAVAAIVIFLILLLILRKWAWGPIIKSLKSREDSIARALQESADRQKEAQDLLAHYKARLDKAEGESRDLIAKSRQDAAEARQRILDEARQDARKAMDDAADEIRMAKESAIRDIHSAVGELAADMAGKILQREIRPDEHQKMLDQSLEELKQKTARN
ncbi:MAG: F0F1 ATP synthase subunit B [Planctomycetes bacterium]|nr:F0F1 ATP synthase subunit B [Planctomycetota bacterium]